jgi:hypothetical protein
MHYRPLILHLLTRRDILLEPTTGADKSAMGAVNRPLRRSLAYTEFMTLLGNFVRTSGQGKEKRVE